MIALAATIAYMMNLGIDPRQYFMTSFFPDGLPKSMPVDTAEVYRNGRNNAGATNDHQLGFLRQPGFQRRLF